MTAMGSQLGRRSMAMRPLSWRSLSCQTQETAVTPPPLGTAGRELRPGQLSTWLWPVPCRCQRRRHVLPVPLCALPTSSSSPSTQRVSPTCAPSATWPRAIRALMARQIQSTDACGRSLLVWRQTWGPLKPATRSSGMGCGTPWAPRARPSRTRPRRTGWPPPSQAAPRPAPRTASCWMVSGWPQLLAFKLHALDGGSPACAAVHPQPGSSLDS